jgi:hypothetical protein
MTKFDIDSVYLPKWPQMKVRGRKVTKEQAEEIIVRTDTFITNGYCGNDRTFRERFDQTFGIPAEPKFPPFREVRDPVEDEAYSYGWRVRLEATGRFNRSLKTITTEYVHNSWMASAFIFGPTGWCHPDGTISFSHNVGKWPSASELLKEWKKIAKAFPFLVLEAVFMTGESCDEANDSVPAFVVRVVYGRATAFPPSVLETKGRFDELMTEEVFPESPKIEDGVDRLVDRLQAYDRGYAHEHKFGFDETVAMVRRVMAKMVAQTNRARTEAAAKRIAEKKAKHEASLREDAA